MWTLSEESRRGWYEFTSSARLAVDSIRAHKLRSFLTLLGVIIGVASVILVGAAIEGLGAYAEESTNKVFGGDSYLVAQIANAGRMTRKEFFERVRRNKQITMDDLEYLQTTNAANSIYSAYRQRSVDIKRDELICEGAGLVGSSATLAQIRDVPIAEGRFFTEQEERFRQAVIVIGYEVKTLLFPEGGTPIGKTVKINGREFTVIGVQDKLGSAFGRSEDKGAFVPVTLFNRLLDPGRNVAIFGRARPDVKMPLDAAVDLTRAALRSRFHNRPGQPDTFDTLTPDAIRGFIDQVLALVAAVVVPVTCISLVVGGIVIMNIMLVSVTERTREIGIRKAIGARRRDILAQVLIEAVLMAVLGGAIGVAAGALLTEAVGRAFEITMRVTPTYVLLAIGVSSVVGILSGWYPASRASRLDPVVALRAE
ncbi:MAG: ABC transporter permease [Bryobacteraceae bacterium]